MDFSLLIKVVFTTEEKKVNEKNCSIPVKEMSLQGWEICKEGKEEDSVYHLSMEVSLCFDEV